MYCRFQLEWHKQCSMLLRDEIGHESQKELIPKLARILQGPWSF